MIFHTYFLYLSKILYSLNTMLISIKAIFMLFKV